MRIHISLVIILILGTIVTGENNNNSESKTSSILQSSSVAPVSTSHSTPRDEIYIDDEGLEGSGGRGEIHDDLEKDHEYSGSGFGPDDEDSSSSHHTPHHNTNTNNRKDQTDLELGSGDNGGNVDEEDFTTDVKHTDIDPTTTDDEDVDIGEPNIGTERKTNTGLSPSRDENEIDLDPEHTRQPAVKVSGTGQDNQEVLIMNTKSEDRTASFFAQPGILAAVIGGAVVGLLCAILVVMFIVYRMRKKDEGSYALDEPKRSPAVNSYAKNANNREFYA